MNEKDLSDLKEKRNAAMREAEKLAYQYFAECDIGSEREAAYYIYENIRVAGAVY